MRMAPTAPRQVYTLGTWRVSREARRWFGSFEPWMLPEIYGFTNGISNAFP
jgi:hypothetical protein